MIRVDCIQGTPDWLYARLGVVTASNAHRIITPKTLKLSSQASGYAHELLAESALGHPIDNASSGFMERGNILEMKARQWYELQRDCEVEEVGFIMRDDRRAGCSPDGLVGANGGVEIKCPSAAVHIATLLGEADEKHRCQVQMSMWVTEREYWDRVSYNPDLPSALIRFNRDEKFIAALSDAVDQFLEYLLESKLKLQKLGLFQGERIPDLRVA